MLATTAVAERRTALVMGNAAYEQSPLQNPGNDARDMAAALRRLGFEVTLVRDADLRTMREAIEAFSQQLRQGGVGLFYFAGHGVQVSGENYMLPLGMHIRREQDVPYEAVPVGRILGGMEDANNQLNIIILDACRDNPFARSWRSIQRGLAPIQAAPGTLIAYATAPGKVANDGDGRNGVYTAHLLRYLMTPGLSVEHLLKRVRAAVIETTRGEQTPWELSSLIEDFFFAAPPISPPSVSSPSPGEGLPEAPPRIVVPPGEKEPEKQEVRPDQQPQRTKSTTQKSRLASRSRSAPRVSPPNDAAFWRMVCQVKQPCSIPANAYSARCLSPLLWRSSGSPAVLRRSIPRSYPVTVERSPRGKLAVVHIRKGRCGSKKRGYCQRQSPLETKSLTECAMRFVLRFLPGASKGASLEPSCLKEKSSSTRALTTNLNQELG